MKQIRSCLIVAIVLMTTAAAAPAGDKPYCAPADEPLVASGEDGVQLIASGTVSAILETGGEPVRISGRASIHLAASESELKEGVLGVHGFNLAFVDVPQSMLGGDQEGQPTGLLGFAAAGEPQRVRYDRSSGSVKGQVRGFVDAAYMARLIRSPALDGKQDLFETATQPASLEFDLVVGESLEPGKERVRATKANLRIGLEAEQSRFLEADLAPFKISVERRSLELQIASWLYFEAAQRLCVQPVRIFRFRILSSGSFYPFILLPEYTGAGLPFGQPGATTQWAKADVVFTYRQWKTLWNPAYFVVDTNGAFTSAEQSALLAEVDDDDCIEVYFIDEFDPVDWGGGGATWGSGTAGAKIISSDANAAGGIDFNHLAHELGHVLGLLHPGNAPTASAVAGSSNTVMCPSGFLNDNPSRNSQENENNLSNPLLQFSLKLLSAGPDCQTSADCGACP